MSNSFGFGGTNAAVWSVFWVVISLMFAGYLYVAHGPSVASLFVTGYALEKVPR